MVIALALPAGLLGLTAAAAWLASSGADPGLGPMSVVPWRLRPASTPLTIGDDTTPPATTYEKVSPFEAELRNGLIPYSRAPLFAAAPYQLAVGGETTGAALGCLTAAIYYEAAQEPLAGKRAVAQVVLNRRASASFPDSICGVVQQGAPRPGCQFTFECDGSLGRKPDPGGWAAAQSVAQAALDGAVDPDVGAATHYHADYVVPVWATQMLKLVKIGRHIFYRWQGARLPVPLAAPLPDNPADALIEAAVAPEPVPAPSLAAPAGAPAPAGGQAAPLTPPNPSAAASPPAIVAPAAPPTFSPPPTPAEPARPQAASRPALPDRSLRSGPV